MAGLLEFMNSPAGMGLLSAVAAGAAGARKGTPWNNVGRGALGGLAGYSQAQDQLAQQDENAFAKQMKQMQMDQMQRQLADQQKMRESLQALHQPAGPYQADNPFGEDLGNLQNEASFAGKKLDPVTAAVLPYAQPDAILKMFGPQADENKFGKVMPHNYTPESLAKYQQSGNFSDLSAVGGNANFGNVNPGQFTPESLEVYAQTGRYGDLVPFRAPIQIDQGNRKAVVNPGTGRVEYYDVAPKITDTPQYQAAQEEAKARAKAGVVSETAGTAKEARSADFMEQIDKAESLLPSATGSMAGAALSKGKRAVGLSDESTQANQQLKLVAGWMRANVPRMEGPQSDKDVEMYEVMSGKVGDETIPIEDRQAALQTLRELHSKYTPGQAAKKPSVNAQPMPAKPSPLTLKKGVTYQTPRGPLRWNGKAFEDVQ